MRRIVNGVTYNTDTSTLIATSTYDLTDERGPRGKIYLFQNRHGAFFELDEETTIRRDRNGEIYEDQRPVITPKTRDEAHKWVMEGEVDLLSDVFDEPPEAEDTQAPEATIYTRVPLSLKSRVEVLARASNQSLNTYVLRCLESYAATDRVGGHLGEIIATSMAAQADPGPGAFSERELREMIEHMGNVAEDIARMLGRRGKDLETVSTDICDRVVHREWRPRSGRNWPPASPIRGGSA